MKASSIKIGMIGLGTVGSGVYEILQEHHALLSKRVGAPLEIVKIAVQSKNKKRGVKVPSRLLTTKVGEVFSDPRIQIVVELMGGVHESRRVVMQAMRNGKHLVTANKALLALHGKEIFKQAKLSQVDVCFEAAVGGGI